MPIVVPSLLVALWLQLLSGALPVVPAAQAAAVAPTGDEGDAGEAEGDTADDAEQAPEPPCTPADATADAAPCEERRPISPETLPPLHDPGTEGLWAWQADPVYASAVPVALPRLVSATADETELAWRAIKQLGSLATQWRTLRTSGTEQLVCTDLVDFRDLTGNLQVPFAFRDQFRGRSWVRPSLGRVLVAARMRWLAERPDGTVSLGDIAQPGCGQLSYGTLVRTVQGAERDAALLRLRRVLGEPLIQEWRTGADFPLERDRLRDPTTPILVESRVLGLSDDGSAARLAVRKFRPAGLPDKPRLRKKVLAGFDRDVRVLLADGTSVRDEPVVTWDPAGRPLRVWLQHRVSRSLGRQLVAISRVPQGATLDRDTLIELRLANWQPGKPDSFGGEVRWLPVVTADGQPGWKRLVQLREAGHRSHTSGRDADIAYQTVGNRALHREALKHLDVQASWRWLEVLAETAQLLGTPVERIYVGPKVYRLFKKRLTDAQKASQLWQRLLHVEEGHDAHHHVRLVGVEDVAEQDALAALHPDNLPIVPTQRVGGPAETQPPAAK